MLNAVGLQNVGVRAFVAEKIPVLRNFDTPVIANVFGYSLEEYSEVIRILEDAPGLAAYELNISCPNVKQGGIQFGCDPVMVSQVVGCPQGCSQAPPVGQTFAARYRHWAYRPGGRRSRSGCVNRGQHLSRDVPRPATGKSRLGCPTGGLSGPAIRPITLRLVWEVAKKVGIPVIGLGGIEKVDDVLEYLAAGATAVQVGTASFVRPDAIEQLRLTACTGQKSISIAISVI